MTNQGGADQSVRGADIATRAGRRGATFLHKQAFSFLRVQKKISPRCHTGDKTEKGLKELWMSMQASRAWRFVRPLRWVAPIVVAILVLSNARTAWEMAAGRSVTVESQAYNAAYFGDTAQLRQLLRHHRFDEVQTAWMLTAASSRGQTDALHYLLEHGLAADSRVPASGATPLMYAIGSTRPTEDAVRVLLAHGADPNARAANGHTPLIRAAVYNKVEIARRLLAAGADINATDNMGRTALSHAIARGHEEVRRLLVENGATLPAGAGDGSRSAGGEKIRSH
jgi:hypothetical protein